MSVVVHCPECGAITRQSVDGDGDELAICTNNDCPRVVVAVVSKQRGIESVDESEA